MSKEVGKDKILIGLRYSSLLGSLEDVIKKLAGVRVIETY